MRVGSLLKSSFIDYPDRIAAVLFTRGCNFRCPYCHNRELLESDGPLLLPDEIDRVLAPRIKYLDGLVISGGEPTLHPDLPDWIRHLKKTTGLAIKLDTNGTQPGVLRRLIRDGLVDFVAMDVKGPSTRLPEVAGRLVDVGAIRESVRLLMEGDLPYEFRTTVARELLSPDDLTQLAEEISGARRYVLQSFRDNDEVLAGPGLYSPYTPAEMEQFRKNLQQHFETMLVRG